MCTSASLVKIGVGILVGEARFTEQADTPIYACIMHSVSTYDIAVTQNLLQRGERGIGNVSARRQIQRLQLRQVSQRGEPSIGDVCTRAEVHNPVAGCRRHCCQLRKSGIGEVGNGDCAHVRQTAQQALERSKLGWRNV